MSPPDQYIWQEQVKMSTRTEVAGHCDFALKNMYP